MPDADTPSGDLESDEPAENYSGVLEIPLKHIALAAQAMSAPPVIDGQAQPAKRALFPSPEAITYALAVLHADGGGELGASPDDTDATTAPQATGCDCLAAVTTEMDRLLLGLCPTGESVAKRQAVVRLTGRALRVSVSPVAEATITGSTASRAFLPSGDVDITALFAAQAMEHESPRAAPGGSAANLRKRAAAAMAHSMQAVDEVALAPSVDGPMGREFPVNLPLDSLGALGNATVARAKRFAESQAMLSHGNSQDKGGPHSKGGGGHEGSGS